MNLKIGFGGGAIADYPWNLSGEQPWTEQDNELAIECLESLPELGISHIDTANRYGGGISEQTIGNVMRDTFSVYSCDVFTKVSLGTIGEMQSDYEESAQRLGKINGLLLHNPDFSEDRKIRIACEWMKSLGLNHIGFSTEPTIEARMYYNIFKLNAIQFPYSFWDRRAETEIFPWAGALKIANRVLGGPSQYGKADILQRGLNFIASRAREIDVFLIGTRNPEHLKECVDIFNQSAIQK